MSELFAMTNEERITLANDLENQGDINDEAERFKGSTKIWISILRDIQGYPYLSKLVLDDDEQRKV
ncbi:hypothetical protein JKG47_00945 [Acidithiobacillus sp. MC6.1]|nr:hypothetical protein [Acidithiobacillus sp. MC6.1]